MISQLRSSFRSSSPRNLPPSVVVYEKHLIKRKDKVHLLRASSIESEIVWKARSFDFAYIALHSKFGDPHSSEQLIAFVREYFPLDTTQSESNAQIKVTKFRSSFNDVSHLSPLGFYDSDGLDMTDIIYKTPRPINICFFEVKFDLPLAMLGSSFTMD